MGRIKTKQILRLTKDLMKLYGDQFNDKFENNKEIVQKFAQFPSKKLRNVVSGYITRLVKNKQEI